MAIMIFQRTVKNIIHFNSSIKWIRLGIEIGKSKDFGCPFSNFYPYITLDLGKGREGGEETTDTSSSLPLRHPSRDAKQAIRWLGPELWGQAGLRRHVASRLDFTSSKVPPTGSFTIISDNTKKEEKALIFSYTMPQTE